MKTQNIRIGNIKPENPFFLAPLAGVTDSSFRRICKEQGASLVYTEMVSGKGLYYNNKNTDKLLSIHEDEKPVAFQIFGSEPEVIAYTAEELSSRDNCILDINMGCPVPKIVKNGEGSALLKNPGLVYDLVYAAVKKASKPVTAKIRIGWDENSINGVEVARAVEAAGAHAVGVHGRTREQYYSGKADWTMISKIKKAVNIPVIGNGDIFSGQGAIDMLDETGCDFVMIARGAMGNPWIFRDALALWNNEPLPEKVEIAQRMSIAIRQLNMVVAEKGEYVGVREMRKHLAWYLKGVRGTATMRNNINKLESKEALEKAMKTLFP